jgi:hypothetical protein
MRLMQKMKKNEKLASPKKLASSKKTGQSKYRPTKNQKIFNQKFDKMKDHVWDLMSTLVDSMRATFLRGKDAILPRKV